MEWLAKSTSSMLDRRSARRRLDRRAPNGVLTRSSIPLAPRLLLARLGLADPLGGNNANPISDRISMNLVALMNKVRDTRPERALRLPLAGQQQWGLARMPVSRSARPRAEGEG